jgi:PIN domain nuclease of toxin-antitoxin system
VNFLLDTCVILWAARNPSRLTPRVRDLLLDPKNEVTASVVSAWEIAVKPTLGISDPARWFRIAAEKLKASILPVRLEHIALLQTLPLLHRDPFDRILIAQALSANAELVTPDEAIRQYAAVRSVWG